MLVPLLVLAAPPPLASWPAVRLPVRDVVALGAAGDAACVADAGARPVAVGSREERRALAPSFDAVLADADGADVVIEATGTVDVLIVDAMQRPTPD